jgi:DNA-directed RNA polymerase subunit RPC12/RpoP
MNIKPGFSSVIKPERNQKRLFRCGTCGHLFMGVKFLFLARCPKCGGLKVYEEDRVKY